MNLLNLICFVSIVSLVSCTEFPFLPKHGLTPLIKARAKAGGVYESTVSQPLDNFDSENKQRWEMRYMYNDEFFNAESNGPIFIMLGGEWTISPDMLQDGQMYDMARQNGAYMMYTEHRYYGNSFPTKDLSTDSMQYFNTDQALADVVNLIRIYKAGPIFNKSKVVVFGGSYSGNMAIWLREKYPNDIFAAVSSSAPVLSKTEFKEYFEVVQTVLGSECSGIISRAIDQILLLFGTPEGAIKVQRDFNTCKPVNTNKPLEVSHFIQVISTVFSNSVQYDSCGKIKKSCDQLIEITNMDEYSKLALILKDASGSQCIPTYPDVVKLVQDTTVTPGQNGRQWIYQVCFQIGYMQVSTSPNQPFRNTISLDTYHGFCSDYFGHSVYNPIVNRLGVDRTNMIYGGLNPNVTRVVSVHGGNDPWHKLGLNKSLNALAPVLIAEGASHTFDLASINLCDNEQMIAAKLTVQKYIKDWLDSA